MPSAFLKVVAGARQGLNVPLTAGDPLVIGRKRGDMLLDDPLVSSTHAQIVARNEGWYIQDLGSTNGTLVDGRLVREAPLRPGSEISVGSTRLVLFVGLDDPATEGEVEINNRGATEIAWLLDEELVELKGNSDRTSASADVIDQDLRLPPGLRASVECVAARMGGPLPTHGTATGRKTERYPSPIWRPHVATP